MKSRGMIEKTYKLHMYQKGFMGESNTVTERTFCGVDQADIDKQVYESENGLLEDPCVISAFYKEVTE